MNATGQDSAEQPPQSLNSGANSVKGFPLGGVNEPGSIQSVIRITSSVSYLFVPHVLLMYSAETAERLEKNQISFMGIREEQMLEYFPLTKENRDVPLGFRRPRAETQPISPR